MVLEASHFTPSILLTQYELYCAGNFWMKDAPGFFEKIKRELSRVAAPRYCIRIVIENIHSSAFQQLFDFLRYIHLRLSFKEFESCQVFIYYRQDDTDTEGLLKEVIELTPLELHVFALPERNPYQFKQP